MKKSIKLSKLIIVALCFISFSGFSQSNKELGLRISSFSSFDVLYKKERTENKFMRYSLTPSYFRLTNNNLAFSTGFAIGWEKRTKLVKNLSFTRGFEPRVYLKSSGTTHKVSPGIGYNVGLIYNLKDNFNIGFELTPYLSSSMYVNSQGFSPIHFSGFKSSFGKLSVTYKIGSKSKD